MKRSDSFRLGTFEKVVLVVDGIFLAAGIVVGIVWIVLRFLGSELPEPLIILRDYGVLVVAALLAVVLFLGLRWKARTWIGRRSGGSTRL